MTRWTVIVMVAMAWLGGVTDAADFQQRTRTRPDQGRQQRVWQSLVEHVTRGDVVASEQLIQQYRLDPNGHQRGKISVLSIAAARGHLELCKMLIRHGAEVNRRGAHGCRPLHTVADKGHVKIAELLLDRGAQIDAKDNDGWTPLRFAVSGNRKEMAHLLLKRRALVDVRDVEDASPLFDAVIGGDPELVALLLNAGANPRMRDGDRSTPLHRAAEYGTPEVTRLLLNHNALVNATETGGETPLFQAIHQQQDDTAAPLVRWGAELKSRDLHVDPILAADDYGSRPCARFLDLANQIASCAEATDPRRALTGVCRGSSKRLKSDAFVAGKSWRAQPVVQVALVAAQNAAGLGLGRKQITELAFQRIINADVARVEKTTGLSWRKYLTAIDQRSIRAFDLDDLVHEVADSLFFPVFVGQRLQSTKPPLRRGHHNVRRRAQDAAVRVIVNGKSTLDLIGLNASWHKPGNQLPDRLVPLRDGGWWHPLFDGTFETDNGISLFSLTSSRALVLEGKMMSNCLGGGSYAQSCLAGSTHILSVRKRNQPIANIELMRSKGGDFVTPSGSRWVIKQMKGIADALPPDDASVVWESFKDQVRNRRVPLSPLNGEMAESKQQADDGDAISQIAGYRIEASDDVLPQILAHYNHRVVAYRGRKATPIPLIGAKTVQELELLADRRRKYQRATP